VIAMSRVILRMSDLRFLRSTGHRLLRVTFVRLRNHMLVQTRCLPERAAWMHLSIAASFEA
jgi:hypothetical protein